MNGRLWPIAAVDRKSSNDPKVDIQVTLIFYLYSILTLLEVNTDNGASFFLI